MKRFLSIILGLTIVLSFSACGNKQEAKIITPDDVEPIYYTDENALPEDTYFIAHPDTITDKLGMVTPITKYYPLLKAEKTFSEKRTTHAGYDFNRVVWVNYNIDEGLIPTMYEGDELIYKSSTYIPVKYALEKFFDNGYTLGVCGLVQDLSENYKFVSNAGEKKGKGFVLSTTDASGFQGLDAESIYLVAVGEERITPMNMSLSGTVTGLNVMDKYECDVRTGTEKIAAILTCNARYFSSAETYMFGSFTFITDIIARMNIPSYVTDGYYEINGGGIFRYAVNSKITDWHDLKPSMCNDTIYTYGENGAVNGTTIGLVFDENDFLAEPTEKDYAKMRNNYEERQTFEEVYDYLKNGITLDKYTSLKTDSGYYYGYYLVTDITEQTESNNYMIYRFTGVNVENDEELDFYYRVNKAYVQLEKDSIYQFTFRLPTTANIKAYVVKDAMYLRPDKEEELETKEYIAGDQNKETDSENNKETDSENKTEFDEQSDETLNESSNNDEQQENFTDTNIE